MSSSKLILSAASGVGGAGLDIDEVFSTYLYDGNSSTQTITNGIDLSGEGGLVWVKKRNGTTTHSLVDSERGDGKMLQSSSTDAEINNTGYAQALTSTGFTVYNWTTVNNSGDEYVSWSFRKAPKFFDVVTYTGDGTNGRQISHNLGHDVGMMLIKKTSSADDWRVFHRSQSNKYAALNSTFQFQTDGGNIFGNPSNGTATAPTSTHFTVANDASVNQSSATYVAYLFAHNNGDGDFGPDGDADIIKCGSYTGDGGAGTTEVNLGFEPQWILVKASSAADNWYIIDNMRGWATHNNTANDAYFYSNANNAEATAGVLDITSTGFKTTLYSNANVSGRTYIYMAIRRGPLVEPASATDVFAMDSAGLSANSEGVYFTSNFPVDFTINKERTHTSDPWIAMSRLQGNGNYLDTSSTAAETSGISNGKFDRMTGWMDSGSALMSWMWKRARGYFDVVTFSGNYTARTINHNLDAVPEMIWVKSRSNTRPWIVYHSATGNDRFTILNATDAQSSSGETVWNQTTPTSSVFSVGAQNAVNANGENFIACLFATVAGVSKVGSFTGTTSDLTIDCGFSSGARFVLIKLVSGSGDWVLWDSTRGIVSGNDPYVLLNSTAAEVTNTDFIDPHSSGFTVTAGYQNNLSEYIFYAIA